jgi:hypothetical protein
MAIEIEAFRTTSAPDEVTVTLSEGRSSLAMTLDEATELSLDVLEMAYGVRAGDPVPVLARTGQPSASPRYRPTARIYGVASAYYGSVRIDPEKLIAAGKRVGWPEQMVEFERDAARALGQHLLVLVRESRAGIYDRPRVLAGMVSR